MSATDLYQAIRGRDIDTARALATDSDSVTTVIRILMNIRDDETLRWLLSHVPAARSLFLNEAVRQYNVRYVNYALAELQLTRADIRAALAILQARVNDGSYDNFIRNNDDAALERFGLVWNELMAAH